MDRRPMAPVLNILLTLLHRLLLLLLFGSGDPSSLMGESGENILVVEFNGCGVCSTVGFGYSQSCDVWYVVDVEDEPTPLLPLLRLTQIADSSV